MIRTLEVETNPCPKLGSAVEWIPRRVQNGWSINLVPGRRFVSLKQSFGAALIDSTPYVCITSWTMHTYSKDPRSSPRFDHLPGLPPSGMRFPSTSQRGWRPFLLIVLSSIPVLYSVWTLGVVALAGDIGVNCVLGIEVQEVIPDDYLWSPDRPVEGDRLVRIGGWSDRLDYPAYVEAEPDAPLADRRAGRGRMDLEGGW